MEFLITSRDGFNYKIEKLGVNIKYVGKANDWVLLKQDEWGDYMPEHDSGFKDLEEAFASVPNGVAVLHLG